MPALYALPRTILYDIIFVIYFHCKRKTDMREVACRFLLGDQIANGGIFRRLQFYGADLAISEVGTDLLQFCWPQKAVHLTIECEHLFSSIQNTVSQYQVTQEVAKEIRRLDAGTMRIGTLSSVSCHWLPQLIQAFQTKYPNV